MNPIEKNKRVILKLMGKSQKIWLGLSCFLEKTKISKQDIIDILAYLDSIGIIQTKPLSAGNGEIIEIMAKLLPQGKIAYYEILKSTKTVPSIVVSLDGKRAIRVEEIGTEWNDVPMYLAKYTIVKVNLHPHEPLSIVELRKFWLDTSHDGFNWEVENEQNQIEMILLAIGEYLDSNKVPDIPHDNSFAAQVPLTNEIFQLKTRTKASNSDIINYLIHKNLWSWRFGLDDVIISYNDSSRLGIELDELIRIARKYENEYWTIDDYGVFKYLPDLIREYDEKDNEIMPKLISNKSNGDQSTLSKTTTELGIPVEITESLERFRKEYPEPSKVAFIIMKFGKTKSHEEIINAIKSVLSEYGIVGIRADEKQYHDDLFPIVLTYLFGCGFGIAIFERIEADDFNPNVSLEVGYMFALAKPVCLFKDKTLQTLHADLVGKLYKTFDTQSPKESIPNELKQWLIDKDLIEEFKDNY